jgi:toxin ParE1/3/4
MRAVVFAALARRDLERAWDYVAKDNVKAADRLCEQLEQAIKIIAQMPGGGHQRADVRDERYRFWTVKPYVITYRYTRRTVMIVRVLHGAMDIGRILGTRRE